MTEFFKLRRKKALWFLAAGAFLMPVLTALMFGYLGKTDVAAEEFYRWAAFGFTLFILLPTVLGVLALLLMYHENRNDMTKQLWIVPVGRTEYLLAKFFLVMLGSVSFMMLTAFASELCGILCGCVTFSSGSFWYLLKKCFEIGILTAFAIVPVLAFAAVWKGYLLPFCVMLLYVFSGFFLMGENGFWHPVCAAATIIMRNGDLPGVAAPQTECVTASVFCILLWALTTFAFARFWLRRR